MYMYALSISPEQETTIDDFTVEVVILVFGDGLPIIIMWKHLFPCPAGAGVIYRHINESLKKYMTTLHGSFFWAGINCMVLGQAKVYVEECVLPIKRISATTRS